MSTWKDTAALARQTAEQRSREANEQQWIAESAEHHARLEAEAQQAQIESEGPAVGRGIFDQQTGEIVQNAEAKFRARETEQEIEQEPEPEH